MSGIGWDPADKGENDICAAGRVIAKLEIDWNDEFLDDAESLGLYDADGNELHRWSIVSDPKEEHAELLRALQKVAWLSQVAHSRSVIRRVQWAIKEESDIVNAAKEGK